MNERIKFVLRKLTSGARGKIRSKCVNTKYIGGQPNVKVDEQELEIQLLHAAIVEAPFPHELENLKNLPAEVFDYLSNQWAEFSEVTTKKKL